MNRLIVLLIVFFFVNNCSFNENSRIWKDKKKDEGYVYICEICQTPRDVKNIVLTEEDIKKNRKSLFKKCISCLGF